MYNVGIIGLGTMGINFSLNLKEKSDFLKSKNKEHFDIHVFNRTYEKSLKLEKHGIIAHKTLNSFFNKDFRCIFLLLPDKLLNQFLKDNKNLIKKNLIIDISNSYYKETVERSKGFNLISCGVSGGSYGARNGLSIMIGGNKENYLLVKDIFDLVSAKVGEYCCNEYLGENGVGNFVKTTHNAIEYCEMQLLQEVYNIFDKTNINLIYEFIESIKKNKNDSYLLEIFEKIINKKYNGDFLVNKILDKAEQKGTGKYFLYNSLELNNFATSISESLFCRFLSNEKNKREIFKEKLLKKNEEIKEKNIKFTFKDLENAIYL